MWILAFLSFEVEKVFFFCYFPPKSVAIFFPHFVAPLPRRKKKLLKFGLAKKFWNFANIFQQKFNAQKKQ